MEDRVRGVGAGVQSRVAGRQLVSRHLAAFIGQRYFDGALRRGEPALLAQAETLRKKPQ